MKRKSRSLLVLIGLSIFIVIGIFLIFNPFLSLKIRWNLWRRYGKIFTCESVIKDGGGAYFVCYPTSDPQMHFDGLADSKNGNIVYDKYLGAIFAKDDTEYLQNFLNNSFNDVYVYGEPVVRSNFITKVIKNAKTVDELHEKYYLGHMCFYIFINVSDKSYVYDPQGEYDILKDCVNELIDMYKTKYNQDVCADVRLYYVDESEYDYAKEYFRTHVSGEYDFNVNVSPDYEIPIQFGVRNNFYSESMRLTKEEFVEERERINQCQK